MLEDGFSYATRGEWSGRLIVGSMLALAGTFLVPFLLVYGYWFRALRDTVAGEPEPPAWDRWGKLFVDGLRAFLVSLVYVLVPTVVVGGIGFLLTVVVADGGRGGPTAGGAQAAAGVGLVVLLVVAVVVLLVSFTLPAALVAVAAEDSAAAAFGLRRVFAFAFSVEYLSALVQLLFVAAFVSVTGATVVFAPVGAFWGGLAANRIFGTAYRSRIGETGEATAETAEDRRARAQRSG